MKPSMKSKKSIQAKLVGSLATVTLILLGCNNSGTPSYTGFSPGADVTTAPGPVMDGASGTALNGLAGSQDSLEAASRAILNGESNAALLPANSNSLAAAAADMSAHPGQQSGEAVDQSTGSSGSGFPGALGSTAGRSRSLGSGSSSSSSSGGGGLSTGISSLGGTDMSGGGAHGSGAADANAGPINAFDALGKDGSNSQTGYAMGSGGGSSGSGHSGAGIFGNLFGNSAENGDLSGGNVTDVNFGRGPASANGKDGASSPSGSADPANYFSLLNPEDNIFKVVERRYVSKTKQWAFSDAQRVRQSVDAIRK